jgi:hypothetical protein
MTAIGTWPAGRRSVGLRRWLQVALGVIWVADAALQFQPYMFHPEFVTSIIEPAAAGSPAVIADPVMAASHLILRSVPVFNAAFAATQLVLGLGLLWQRTVRPALAGTAGWALAVWWVGEGAGGIFTGSASPLTGAPGAALLYVYLAALLWPPRLPCPASVAPGSVAPGSVAPGSVAPGSVAPGCAAPVSAAPVSARAVSVAGNSRLGPRGSRQLWLLLWGSSAYFLLQGPVSAPGALSSALAGLADGEPGWLASLDRSAASAAGAHGGIICMLLAVIFALIAAAVYVPAATRLALVTAAVSAAAIWVLTENLGEMLTGTGTDPGTGPLLVLLAVAYWPPDRQDLASDQVHQSAGSQTRSVPRSG